MSPTVQVVLAALGVGTVGTAGTVVPKVVNGLRKIGWLVDAICGTSTQPGVQQRVEQLTKDMAAVKIALDKHLESDSPQWRAEGQAWGQRLDSQVADLNTRVSALENGANGTDPVVASRRK
jgi:hypothetical protein